jgi:hypothetical protein
MRHLVAILLLSGCGGGPQLESVFPAADTWLIDAVRKALPFWAEHGVELVEHPSGLPIKVGERPYRVPEEDELGTFGRDNATTYGWSIYIDGELESMGSAPCVVAHEIGHALGMDHVEEGPSLMSPTNTTCAGGCCWSELDEEAFRALGRE